MSRETKNPFFIIIDGIDGSGKTTICNYIKEKTNAQYMRAFGQGPIGKAIREQFLKETNHYNIDVELNWVLTANLETIYDYVIPSISKGYSVVLDRFLSSSYAYQISRMEHVPFRSVKDAYFQRLVGTVLKDITPTLYILCDVSVQNSNSRILARNEALNHFDTESTDKKISTIQGFFEFYDKSPIKNKVKLDCNKDLENVLKDIDLILSDYNLI
jgi:dTMP kinase